MRQHAAYLVRRADRARAGAALVWVAIMLMVFVGIVALALDWGYAFWTAQKLQNAADAAALAGAREVWFSHANAREQAIAIAGANEAGGASVQLDANTSNDPEGDIVVGIYDAAERTFTPSTDPYAANAVAVNARRTTGSLNGPLQLIWGGIFGITEAQLTRWGIAYAEGGPQYSDIIALNASDPQSFYIYGHGYLDLGDGTAQVNSSSASGATYQGTNITFIYDEVNIVGSWNERGNPEIPQDSQNPGQPYVADPLASLPEPYYDPNQPAGQQIVGNGTSIVEYWPGYYPGGINMASSGDHIYLHPGIYVLGGNWDITGGILEGYNTMFYFVEGSVHDRGNGAVYLTPTDIEPYAQHDLQFWQAADNTQTALFNGGTTWTSAAEDDPTTEDVNEATVGTGTMYFPGASVELGGTGDMYFNGLIADKVVVFGDGRKTVTGGYNGDRGGDKVWLVE